MRDLDRRAAPRHQPVTGQSIEHRRGDGIPVDVELRELGPPAGHRLALAGTDQPEEDVPRLLPLVGRELLVRPVSEPGHGAPEAAGALVGLHPQPSAVPLPPQFDERGREQWAPARFVGDLLDEGVDQGRLDPQAAAPRGQLDGPTELVHAHRTDRNMVRGQESGELGERRAATVEVAPQRDDRAEPVRRGHGSRRQVLDERGLLVVVGAAGEELLELVHEEHQALVGSRRGDGGAKGTGSGRDGDERRPQLLHGVLPGAHRRRSPPLAPREQRGPKRRQQPSRDDGGLATPESPMTPRRPTCTVRAASSPTRRSRPKNHSASVSSKDARPLNGQRSCAVVVSPADGTE